MAADEYRVSQIIAGKDTACRAGVNVNRLNTIKVCGRSMCCHSPKFQYGRFLPVVTRDVRIQQLRLGQKLEGDAMVDGEAEVQRTRIGRLEV